MRFSRVAALVAAFAFSGPLAAAGMDDLRHFLAQTKSAKSKFTQMVLGRNGKLTQKAGGTFAFQRPGKFRFVYEQPYAQVIVGDGQKLWTWDKDLNQVTVKPMTQALGATPAALLTGDGQLERNFDLKDAGESDGLAWVEASPKQQESGFDRVRIGFGAGQLRAMEVRDNFGQTTLIQFSAFEANPRLDPAEFRFTPPKGADVVGD
ncbi:outer membrane lipoprotein chaperone LolA [Niveibacterium sp. 24ML]|uniref:outer membrane lipoprotein chaperone LolA n=1 Tax=Niveibacterium sp. 24ML TaxID=2985512 RepID=UPI00227093F9|nr:outer membrane lipoprotein chaperone LolA [Niveibacterium sp. 24ML]MCX9157185.1 outer membrane lipoprotein chaperone LolA [Niveibacterium sp. 24ML]